MAKIFSTNRERESLTASGGSRNSVKILNIFFFKYSVLIFFVVFYLFGLTAKANAYFSDNFDALANGNISGQNGWTNGGQGTWTVGSGGTGGGKIVTQTGTTTNYLLNYISNGPSLANQILKVDFEFSAAGYVPQFWVRATNQTGVNNGYLVLLDSSGTHWLIARGSNLTTFASSAAVILNPNTWYTAVAQVINNTSNHPVISLYVYPQGGSLPATPTLTYIDTANTFQSGYFGLGDANTTLMSYDNVVFTPSTLSASSSSIALNSTGNIVTLTGVNTTWATGTPGTPTFTLSGGTGASITSQTITSATTSVITINAGSAIGSLTITDPSTGATTTVSVSSSEATLSNLIANQGTLSPVFSSGTNSYTDNVANSVTSITVTPTVNQVNATVKVNGTTVTSGSASGAISLNIGSNTITTIVTAQDGTTTDTYTITVKRAGSIAISDPDIYWSPYNWQISGSNWIQSSPGGAYLKVAFQGSTLGLVVDTTPESLGSVPLSDIMVDTYIDGTTTPITETLANAVNNLLTITSSLSDSNHYAVIYLASTTPNSSLDRWNIPAEALRITSIQLGSGDTLLPLTGTLIQPSLTKILMYGDSITEGYNQTNDESAYSAVLARMLGVEYGQLGYSSLGWNYAGLGNIPEFYNTGTPALSSWRNYNGTASLLNDNTNVSSGYVGGAPNDIFFNIGTNDFYHNGASPSTLQTQLVSWIGQIRTATNRATAIYIVEPFVFSNGNSTATQYHTAVANAVTSYRSANPSDTQVFLLDLGTSGWSILSSHSDDGVHPTNAGAVLLANNLDNFFTPGSTNCNGGQCLLVLSTDATLSTLTSSQGTLSPTFASGTTSYTESVLNGVTSLTVTPTVNQANATVTVNGTTVTSDSPSGSINLNVGSNTITTIVTAQDGSTTDTYTITVTRATRPTTDISTAGVTGFTAPATFGTPQVFGNLTPGLSQYTVTGLTWSPTDNPFHAATAYTATVVLTSVATYKFPVENIASPTTDVGTVNSIGTTSGGDVSGNQLTFTVLFTTTAAKATPTLSVTNSLVTYNTSPQAATVSGSVAGVVSNIKYNGSLTVPTTAGTYAITADFAPTDSADYNSLTGATAGNFVINIANQGTITASAGANGSITPSGSVSVNNGSDQAFTITANFGYHIDTVTADSVAVSATSPYTFTNVTADHTISATFAADYVSTPARITTSGGHMILPPVATTTITPIINLSTGSGQATYNFGTVTLKNGSKGNAVKELQRFLNANLRTNLKIDGVLGKNTIAIIKKWQKAHELVADGLVGVKTKAVMNAEVK